MSSGSGSGGPSTQCLICRNVVEPEGVGEDLLEQQLRVVYVVSKLLEIPQHLTIRFLAEYGNPSEWATFCAQCHTLVTQGEEIFREIQQLKKKHQKVRDMVRLAMQVKPELDDLDCSMELGEAPTEIREFLEILDAVTVEDAEDEELFPPAHHPSPSSELSFDSDNNQAMASPVSDSTSSRRPQRLSISNPSSRHEDDSDVDDDGDTYSPLPMSEDEDIDDDDEEASSSDPRPQPQAAAAASKNKYGKTYLTFQEVLQVHKDFIQQRLPFSKTMSRQEKVQRKRDYTKHYISALAKKNHIKEFPCRTCPQVFSKTQDWTRHTRFCDSKKLADVQDPEFLTILEKSEPEDVDDESATQYSDGDTPFDDDPLASPSNGSQVPRKVRNKRKTKIEIRHCPDTSFDVLPLPVPSTVETLQSTAPTRRSIRLDPTIKKKQKRRPKRPFKFPDLTNRRKRRKKKIKKTPPVPKVIVDFIIIGDGGVASAPQPKKPKKTYLTFQEVLQLNKDFTQQLLPLPDTASKEEFLQRRRDTQKHTVGALVNANYVKEFQCQTCPQVFSTYQDWLRHTRFEGCDQNPDRNSEFGASVVINKIKLEKNPPIQCLQCRKTFDKAAHLTRHILKFHKTTNDQSQRQFKCDHPGCSRACWTSKELQGHVKQVHLSKEEGAPTYPCDVCGKVYTTKRYLVNHKRLHNLDNPYLCQVCGKSFKLPEYLSMHSWTHKPKEDQEKRYAKYRENKEKRKLEKETTTVEKEKESLEVGQSG